MSVSLNSKEVCSILQMRYHPKPARMDIVKHSTEVNYQMLWRKGNLPPLMLKMKTGECQYGGQPAGSLSNEKENELESLSNHTQT